jgi:hypothetical protein
VNSERNHLDGAAKAVLDAEREIVELEKAWMNAIQNQDSSQMN